jgi:hypothetical protein
MTARTRGTASIVLAVVLLPGCGDDSGEARSTTTAPPATAAAERFRFVRKPIVVFASQLPNPDTNFGFLTYIRMNRALPRDRRGVRAALALNGVTDLPSLFTVSRRRHCYKVLISSQDGLQPAPEDQTFDVDVSLRLFGSKRPADTARVIARRVPRRQFGRRRAEKRLFRRLGCPVERL